MSSTNNLTNPAVSASGEVPTLLIEKFDGQVKRAYTERTNMMKYFDLREVQGTNSVSNKYMGTVGVQGLAPGKSVKAQSAEFDKNQLTIDTTVIARSNVFMLHDVQSDIEVKGKLAEEEADALLRLEDRMLIQQLAYGAIANTQAKRTNPRVRGHGFSIDVKVKADTMQYPNAVLGAIEYVLEQQLEQNTPIEKFAAIMPYKYFNVLRDAERIINATYKTASDTMVTGFVLKSYNLPIVPTNNMPNLNRDHVDIDGVVQDHHLLSNAGNGFRYDVVATGADTMANIVAILFGTEGLMVGRSISPTGKIWWNDDNKVYYIDAWLAEGAIPDRWEQLGIVRIVADASASDDVTVRQRANRKVIPVTTTTLPTT